MRTEYEEYRDTGMVGIYDPDKAVLRTASANEVPLFQDILKHGNKKNLEIVKRRFGARGRAVCPAGDGRRIGAFHGS